MGKRLWGGEIQYGVELDTSLGPGVREAVVPVRLGVILVFLLGVSGCCDESLRPQGHWGRAMAGYELLVTSVDRVQESAIHESSIRSWNGETYLTEIPTMKLAMAGYTGLEVWYRNESARKMSVDWDKVTYIDENGESHGTYWYEYGASYETSTRARESDLVEPGRGVWVVIRPTEKTYDVSFGFACQKSNRYSEALVPWKFGDLSEADMQSYLEAAATMEKGVKWIIPVNLEGKPVSYEINQMIVSTRYSRRTTQEEIAYYQEHQTEPEWVRKGSP